MWGTCLHSVDSGRGALCCRPGHVWEKLLYLDMGSPSCDPGPRPTKAREETSLALSFPFLGCLILPGVYRHPPPPLQALPACPHALPRRDELFQGSLNPRNAFLMLLLVEYFVSG